VTSSRLLPRLEGMILALQVASAFAGSAEGGSSSDAGSDSDRGALSGAPGLWAVAPLAVAD